VEVEDQGAAEKRCYNSALLCAAHYSY